MVLKERMKKKALATLKRELWKLRSEFTRRRDSDWRGYLTCISCGKVFQWKEVHAGHYHSRRHDFTTELLLDERNVNGQCRRCNTFGDMYTGVKYLRGLEAKYGANIESELQNLKDTPKKWKYSEVEELIEVYKNKLKDL